ncbi:MAG: Fic family protein [Firmicutes bacterium]|nr:Fic family protein [Bacillota bacterium]MCM1402125.1 Fic family protein [Bacteroides sp.]MCM1478015.1 Fic family protein [Bacteroides sp.]
MKSQLEKLVGRYRQLGIDHQLDYDKFYLYSIITHSTAIEGSTITELENQIMFDNGIALKGKSLVEQNMNLDLKAAYERALVFAREQADVTIDRLKELSALTMKNTGSEYHTALGDFSSANGDLRLVNVTAGVGGRSYMAFNKVPQKLKEFCDTLNALRRKRGSMSMQELYELSFDAHYNLVTIHPWADGNGRMARLLMNWLQFEFGLIPSRIFSDDKEDYIKALVATRQSEDMNIFRQFMTDTMIAHLNRDISSYLDSVGEDTPTGQPKKKVKTRNRILELLRENPNHTTRSLAEELGITAKGVERHLAILKAEGILHRIGPDKGGRWQITD